jgi:hypothetical protein
MQSRGGHRGTLFYSVRGIWSGFVSKFRGETPGLQFTILACRCVSSAKHIFVRQALYIEFVKQ